MSPAVQGTLVLVVTLVILLSGAPVAFALGAIVAPPDAVAATAVGRRIGLPRRIVTILEGESLVNDATALVSLRTAIAAFPLAAGAAGAHAQDVTTMSVAMDFTEQGQPLPDVLDRGAPEGQPDEPAH